MKILALDLGKFKSVACVFESTTGEHSFTTIFKRRQQGNDGGDESMPGDGGDTQSGADIVALVRNEQGAGDGGGKLSGLRSQLRLSHYTIAPQRGGDGRAP